MSDSATPWTTDARLPWHSQNIFQSLLRLMSTESMMPSNHLILCLPLLLLPSIFPSIRVFPNESALHIRWPKYWSFSFSFSPSNEYSRLISFRIDWFDLLAIQGTLKSLLQPQSSKASKVTRRGKHRRRRRGAGVREYSKPTAPTTISPNIPSLPLSKVTQHSELSSPPPTHRRLHRPLCLPSLPPPLCPALHSKLPPPGGFPLRAALSAFSGKSI